MLFVVTNFRIMLSKGQHACCGEKMVKFNYYVMYKLGSFYNLLVCIEINKYIRSNL